MSGQGGGRGRAGSDPAASTSVLLLRDGPAGLETFVVVRDARNESFPGLLVFPGGLVDPEDADERIRARCASLGGEEAARRLSGTLSPDEALAFHVAGIREMFEEAGVLLARREGRWVSPAELEVSFDELRQDLYGKRLDFPGLCDRFDLDLAVDGMHPFAHWITPTGMPRRFDTRFFLAELPAGQDAAHCELETSAGAWLAPAEALERYREGRAQLAPPTFMLLSELAGFESVAAARQSTVRREIPVMLPRPFTEEGGVAFLYPGDVAYPDGDPAAAGPRHRMVSRDGLWVIVRQD